MSALGFPVEELHSLADVSKEFVNVAISIEGPSSWQMAEQVR